MISARQGESIARTYGKYRLMQKLAVGGMGEVWVARNRATGADVAVKLCLGPVASEDAAARFRHEAHIGAMLSHRSIVRIFDLVEEPDGTLLLVMELLRGETLERFLRTSGPLPAREAIAIALPVLSALAHAHDFGVVHRDVTPANIFLAVDPDGHVIPKLVDFGIAKLPVSGIQTLDGRVLGTPRYMAPEQIRSHGEIDGRSDLFSLGVILYEMLTGACPFAAVSPSASLAAVLEAVVDPDPRLEPRVWVELQRALSKRPYERHKGANEMAESLRAASGNSEADLAEALRRLPLSRENLAAGGDPGQPMPGAAGDSVGRREAFFPHGRALAAWVVGGVVVAVCLAVAVAVVLRRSRSDSTVPAVSSMETVAPARLAVPVDPTAPLATSPWMAMPSASAAGATPPTAPGSATPNPRRPSRPRQTKPVATTPGF
jgi:serine/threonine protein kinase